MADKNLNKLIDEVVGEQALAAEAVESGDLDADSILIEAEQIEKYGDRSVAAGAAALARGATLGASDVALTQSGLVAPETLAGLQEQQPVLSTAAEVVGAIAPAFIPGGQVAPAGALLRAGRATTAATKKALEQAIKETGRGRFAKEAAKKILPEIAGSAVEGAAFGAGKLVSEDALGRAELNGENLIANIGMGAGIGGAFGTLIGGTKFAMPGIKGALSPVISKARSALKNIADDGDAAIELVGMPPASAAKAVSRNSAFKQEAADYLRKDLQLELTDDVAELVAKNQKNLLKAGKQIETSLTRMDDAAQASQYALDRNRVFSNLKTKLNPYLDDTVAKEAIGEVDLKKLTEFEDLLTTYQKRSAPLTFKELNKLKQALDDAAKFDNTKTNFQMEVARDLRAAVRQSVEELGDELQARLIQRGVTGFEDLVSSLKAANKSYSIGATIAPHLARTAERKSRESLLTLRDIVLGGAGSVIDPTLGAAALATGKLLKSDFRRKLTILADIERANQQSLKAIKDSTSAFVGKARAVKRPAKDSLRILTNSQLSADEAGKLPSNRRVAFNNLRQRINTLAGDPEAQARQIALNTMSVSRAAPNTALAMGDAMARAITFLHTKLPQDPQGLETQFFKREYQPSDYELAKFERYLQTIEAPLTVLEELESGTITREHTEALREVYPALYAELRDQLVEQLVETKEMSYSKKLLVGSLFDIPVDESLQPDFIIDLQSNFGGEQDAQQAQQAPAVRPTSGGAQRLKMAQREQTEIEQIQTDSES